MKIYEQSGVKFWSDNFSDLKSFDIINGKDLRKRFNATSKFIENFNNDVDNILGWNVGEKVSLTTVNTKVKLKQNYLYLELPFKFFNDYFEEWLGEVCSVNDNFDGEKTSNCWCYKCSPLKKAKSGFTYYSIPWTELKNKIKDGQDWKSNTQFDDISHGQFMLFKNYGIANPIFNFSKGWPKIGSHRMAFTSIVGSDVPFFFLLENDKEFVIKGMWPYFKNKKYCHLRFKINDKLIEFYLSSYWSSFDKNRDDKVGEIVYK